MNTEQHTHLYPGSLSLYHPNSKNSGSALRLEMRMNRKPGDKFNCFFLELANQKSIQARDGKGPAIPASFDWEHKITVKLDFHDVCELLLVLSNQKEQAGPDGRGLFHSSGEGNTLIRLCLRENKACLLGLSRKTNQGEQVFNGYIQLTPAETLGLRHVFKSSLFLMAFHPFYGVESGQNELPSNPEPVSLMAG